MAFADQFDLKLDLPEHWPNLGVYKIGFHLSKVIFSTLVFFLVLPIISAERQYYHTSQTAPNFILALTFFNIPVALLLAMCPWTRYHQGRFKRVWKFLNRPRSSAVFTVFFSVLWVLGVMSITSHTSDNSNCELDLKLAKKDVNYAYTWTNQCQCAKVVAVLSWILLLIWLASTLSSVILLWHEKRLRLERTRADSDF